MDKLNSPTSLSDTLLNILPFLPTCSQSRISGQWFRKQLPLALATATTIHKAQGITAHYGIVLAPSPGTPFARGLDYVGLSRPTKIEHVYLLDELRENLFNGFPEKRAMIANEYLRLHAKFTQ